MIRNFRRSDAPDAFRLLKENFPEEEAILGTDPEGFFKIVNRIYRWDAQLVIRLSALFGRPIYRFLTDEEDGHIVATTLLAFPERAGYVSTVVVDPAYRRRGLAQGLLEEARRTTARARRKYIALDVLSHNAPARALYERLGYRPLREVSMMSHEPDGAAAPARPIPFVRPFRPSDGGALVAIARRTTPPEVEEVLPLREGHLRPAGVVTRAFESESASWTIDRGAGPEGFVGATRSRLTAAGHLTAPIVAPEVDLATGADLVRTALAWLHARGPTRAVLQIPVANEAARAALRTAGFRDALSLWTLYRPVA